MRFLDSLGAEAARAPHSAAIVDANGRVTTRAQLAQRVDAIAAGFAASGLAAGDHVLFAVRPSAESIALIAALMDLGGVVVAAQPGVGDTVFASQMKLVRPRWVVAESALLAAMNSAIVRRFVRSRGGSLPSIDAFGDARLVRVGRWLPGTRAASLAAIVAQARDRAPARTLDAEMAAFIVFTSGTTADPKAVVHSRRSIEATLGIISSQLSSAGPSLRSGRQSATLDGDVLLAKDAHLILPAIMLGATAVMPQDGTFSPTATLDVMRRWRVTHMFEVTANCRALADHVAERGERLPPTLRSLMIGAAPVRASFLRRVADVLPDGATAWCTYGMTEMIPVSAISLAEKLAYEGDGDIVGMPVAGAAARVQASGELVLRGPNLFTGYLGEPPVHEHHTGDTARMDAGRIVLLGRLKDMIIRREYNIYPELHEPVIERISGVKRAAMVGVYDPRVDDERVVLVIEPEAGFDNDAFVRTVENQLRDGPERIDDSALPDLVILAAIPESGRSFKVDKGALRELARERLG